MCVVRGCAVSRGYIDVCNCDMFGGVNVYLNHLKLCVVCIHGRRYVCCGECYVVSNECDEPTSCLVQPIGAHCCEVMYFWCFCFRGELGFLNCDDICMCVVNKHGSVCLCGVCSPWSVCEVVVVPYVCGCGECDACTVVCIACVYTARM